jgi:uncharacterized protein (TIRG00374 family)
MQMKSLIKVVVSGILISALLWRLEWQDFLSQLRRLDPLLTVLAVLILCAQFFVSAWKWQKSLKLHGIEYGLGYLLRILCIGFFFNNFFPTAIGGDTYRVYRTLERAIRPAYPISAIIVERIIGISALIGLGCLAAAIMIIAGSLPYMEVMVQIFAAIALFTLGLMLMWRMGFVLRCAERLKRMRRLEPIVESVRVMRKNRRYLLSLTALSIAFQALAIAKIIVLFAALGMPGQLLQGAVVAAAAGIASVIPFSINGLGVVEGSFVVAALIVGLPYTESVVVALVIRTLSIAAGSVFGLMYLFERESGPPSDRASQTETTARAIQVGGHRGSD